MRYILPMCALAGALVLGGVAAYLRPPGVHQLQYAARRERSKAAGNAAIKDGTTLAACPGEDQGAAPALAQEEEALLLHLGITDYTSRPGGPQQLQRWDGSYPAGWPKWLALPANSYLQAADASLPDCSTPDPVECRLLVKADAALLAAALTAQVPQQLVAEQYAARPLAVRRNAYGPGVSEDSYSFERRDGGRSLQFSFTYGAPYAGWVVVEILNRRMITTTPLQP
jgi:hypothetical protein